MRTWKQAAVVAIAVCAALALSSGRSLTASTGAKAPNIEFLGQAIVPTGTIFAGTTIGGLSSITYDSSRDEFYALSDDQSVINPVRFYTLKIDVGDGHLDNGDVTFVGVTTLLAPDGQPYAARQVDPEGFTLTKAGEFIMTSEGIPTSIAPFVRRYARDGSYLGDLPVPDAFTMMNASHGVRFNLAFEAAAVAPDGRHLFVGMEGALLQDGPAATVNNTSTARILRYNLQTGSLDRQFVYGTDRVAQPPSPGQFSVNGLVELLPFNTQFMLAMERSFSVGAPGSGGTGNMIKLYSVAFPGADNVDGLDSIAGWKGRTVAKQLLFDLDTLGIPLDNIEGMVIGPDLPDGRKSLILVSDNNFAASQFTQFLMFAIW
jgi:hypothetical protein